jgi:hypothetical protein
MPCNVFLLFPPGNNQGICTSFYSRHKSVPCNVFLLFPPGKRQGVPALGIVITDGVSTFDSERTIPSADAARNNGILMFAIGITDQIDLTELQGIANDPNEDFVFEADDFNALASIRDQVVQAACKAASGEQLR